MTPWQSILMIIINKYVRSDQPFFHRYQIMKPKNKDAAVLLLYKLFDCKEYPEKVERTMRRALRDLRDNGYVEFFYPYTPGKYKLTTSGYEKLRKIMDSLNVDAKRPKKPKLNLERGFTEVNLKELLASCEDMKGDHIMWVDLDGNVDITLLPANFTPADWTEQMRDKIKFRYDTFLRGNEYVGLEAARNEEYVDNLYGGLIDNWEADKTGLIYY